MTGAQWISQAYSDFFKKQPWTWIAIAMILAVLSIIVFVIPVIGRIADSLLTPVFVAGIMNACRESEKGATVQIEMLFAGFSKKFKDLAILGAIHLGLVILITVLSVMIFVFTGIIFGLFSGSLMEISKFLSSLDVSNKDMWQDQFTNLGNIAIIVCVLLSFVATALSIIWMMFFFAPALIFFEQLKPLAAIKESFRGCLENVWPFFVYSVALLGLVIIALIPLGLGIIVFMPVFFISQYVSYRFVFGVAAAG